MKRKHSKLKDLSYETLDMKQYLKDPNTTTEEKIMIFKWRTRMEIFEENYRGGKQNTNCILCGTHKDGQKESFECPNIIDKFTNMDDYSNIFNDRVPKETIKKIKYINNIRE